MQKSPLDTWRLATDLSVVDAAILIVGGDPSLKDQIDSGPFQNDPPSFKKRTDGHEGFDGAFSALRIAIQNGQLKAQLRYPARRYISHRSDSGSEYWIITSGSLTAKFSDDFTVEYKELVASEAIAVDKNPSWSDSTIAVPDLKIWLTSRNVTDGFFFTSDEPAIDTLLNVEHDHFSAELALAVNVWKALASSSSTRARPKQAIVAWIDANPEAWQGKGSLSANAKERITTLVNWKP